MSEESSLREIRKLRVRVDDFLREERSFVENLNVCLDRLEELSKRMRDADARSSGWREDLLRLRMEAYEALNDALNRQSRVEHERSHLPESLGSLLLTTEKEFQKIFRKEL